jgi:hypothetical protein
MELFTTLLTAATDTTTRTIITQQSHSITDLVIAIIASSAATTLLQNVFSWKSNKIQLRKNNQELKNNEIDLDTKLQTYYKEQYESVLTELDKLRKKITVLENKVKSQVKLRKEVIQLRKEKVASCKRVDCPNKVI